MKIYRSILVLLIALNVQNPLPAAERVSFQLGTEGGYYDSETLGSRLISRLIGRLNYSKTFDRNFITIKTRLAPELYGLSFAASTIKLNGQLYFGQRLDQFTWQTRFATRNYFYQSDRYDDVSFNVFQIGADVSKAFGSRTSLGFGMDYYYRDSSRKFRSQLDNYAASLFSSYQVNRTTNLKTELTLESFKIRRKYEPDSLNQNAGIRFGPKLIINHRSGFILNFSYQLIRHSSDLLIHDHWENQLELLWGKLFARKWSLFFYLNYLFLPEINQNVPIELTYTPMNNENWYHLKLGFDASQKTEVYLKFGYTRDVLIYSKQDLAGWQFIAGMDFKY